MQDTTQPQSDAAPEPATDSASGPETVTPDPQGDVETAAAAGTSVADPSPPVLSQSAPDVPVDESSAFEALLGADAARGRLDDLVRWVHGQMFTLDIAVQGGLLIAALIPAALFGPRLQRFIHNQIAPRAPYGPLKRAANAFSHVATPIALFITLQAMVMTLDALGRGNDVMEAGVSLLAAWIVIRLVTMVIRSPFWSRVAFYVVWPIAALDAFGVLDNVVEQLNAVALPIGENDLGQPIKISMLDIIRTFIVFGVLLAIANFANRFLQGRISTIDELTPSLKTLLGKILDILMPIVALLIALQLVNFNLASLTIFGGAIGLGVGLGLQNTISNFFAGFTLVADKSIKPGDVIEVGDAFGWVTQMNARYVAIRTRDGTEHLIPNDKFIQDGVINWSHADKVVRLHIGLGVAYATRDLKFVQKLCEETAGSVDRVLSTPGPKCNLVEFGDNSVNFDLRIWINDPANGASNVRSAVMMAIWEKLHEHNIEIPFPQRDLHIKSLPEGLAGRLSPGGAG